jgi:hypothetical protein
MNGCVLTRTLPSYSQTMQKLEFEGFGLGNSRESTVKNSLGIQLNGSLPEAEALGNDCHQLIKYLRTYVPAVNSLILLPLSPRTFLVRVARMMTSVLWGVTLTSTPA